MKVVMYHYVRELENTRYPNIRGLRVSEFKKQIEHFKANYKFVTITDIYDSIYNNKQLPENSIYLTFDDGYLDHYTNVFPILKLNNIEAFFSMPAKILAQREILDVNKIHLILSSVSKEEIIKRLNESLDYYRGREFSYPDNEEIYLELTKEKSRFDSDDIIYIKRVLQTYLPIDLRKLITEKLFKEFVLDRAGVSKEAIINEHYMSYDQVRLMAKSGMVFGCHGYAHDWIGNMTDDQMREDIDKSVDFWGDIITEKIPVMCFPYGSYNEKSLSYARKKGFEIGFGTKVGEAQLNKENALTLQRFDTNDFYPKKQV